MSFNTLEFKFCPRCGERLSYTSTEGFCAYADCNWNNDEANDCTPPAPASAVNPDASVSSDKAAGLVAQPSVSGGECSRSRDFLCRRDLRSARLLSGWAARSLRVFRPSYGDEVGPVLTPMHSRARAFHLAARHGGVLVERVL